MADLVPNIAKGRVNELVRRVNGNDPANSAIIVIPISAGAVTDDQLRDADTFAAMVSAGVTERSSNGWNRKTYTDADLSDPTVDDSGNTQDADIPDPVWTPTSGSDTVTDLVVCFDPDTTGGDDSALIPLAVLDFAITPDGSEVTAVVNADGFFSAS